MIIAYVLFLCTHVYVHVHVHVYLERRNPPETTIKPEIESTTWKSGKITTIDAHPSYSTPNKGKKIKDCS